MLTAVWRSTLLPRQVSRTLSITLQRGMATAATQDPSLVKKDAHPFERAQLEGLMTKRFFYTQAFEIYGGVAGLYDYGPSGASLQATLFRTGEITLSLKKTCSSLTLQL